MNILGSLMLVFFITRAEVTGNNHENLPNQLNPAAATTTTIAPVIPNGQDSLVHYQCVKTSSSYNITIYIKDNAILNYYAIAYGYFDMKKDVNDTCKQEFANRTGNNIVQLTNCTKDTVYLYIMKKPAYIDIEKSNAIIAGGKSFHEYEISCKVQANGTLYNLTNTFTDEKTGEKKKTKENPDLKLALSINPSTLFIGDKVTLTVTDTTDVKNYLYFTDCFATVPDNNAISSINLIKNGSSIETDIIPSVNKASTSGNSSLVFYAFRFATSPKVKISCTIRACPKQDCTAPPKRQNGLHGTGRRQRSVNNELNSDSKTVSVTFEVHDKKQSSGGMKVGHVSPLLLTAIVFGWMKLL